MNRTINDTITDGPSQFRGFTLIELLVVITIIVILLAILTPALDESIYQAELVVCGTTLRSTAQNLINYALDHRRQYPYRPNVIGGTNVQGGPSGSIVHNIRQGQEDNRVLLRPYMDINKSLLDPLCGQIDLDHDNEEIASILANYMIWAGSRYNGPMGPESPMFRIGNRWSWTDTITDAAVKSRFDLLISDKVYRNGAAAFSSHPDDEGVLSFNALNSSSDPTEASFAHSTTSAWSGGWQRGTLDLNFAHEDLAVARVNDVTRWAFWETDPGMQRVGLNAGGNYGVNQWASVAR